MEWSELFDLGKSKLQAGDIRDAIKCFKKALVIAQKNGSKTEEAATLGQLGEIYRYHNENYHEAVDYFEKGLEIVQETGDKALECKMCLGIGEASKHVGDSEKSMKYNNQGFNVALIIGDCSLIARSYYGLGSTYGSLCDYQNSIKCYKKAIDLFKQLNDEEGLGACYGNLSKSYQMLGKYHDAICFREDSLKINVKVGNKRNEAVDLHAIGIIYHTLNESEKAFEYFEKSLAISKNTDYKGLQAQCYCSLGNTMSDLSNFQEAISYYGKCWDIAVQIDDKQTQAIVSNNIGNCLKKLNRHKEANEHYNKSLIIAKEINDKDCEAHVYINMAVSYAEMRNFQHAIDLLEKCIDIASTIDNKELESKACQKLGSIYYLLHKENQGNQACHNTDDNIAKSEEYLKKSLECFDFLFQHLHQRDHFKVSIFDDFIETYELLATVLIETKRPQEALLVCDGGRARALGDRLIFKYGMTQQECSLPKPITYPDVEAILSDDSFSMLHYSLLFNSLAVWVLAKDSMVFKETEKNEFDSAIEILTGEKKEKDENSVTRVITDTVSRAYEMMKIEESVTCENRSLDDCVTSTDSTNEKRTECTSRDDGTGDGDLREASHPLEMLYNCLVAPVLADVQHDEVVIVPDGPMYRVPFAALRDPKTGQFLSDTKRIRLAPSIAVLKVLKECPVDHHSQKGALIVGNPSVGKVMFRGKEREFSYLTSADREVSFLSNMLRQSTILTEERATKAAVLEKLREESAVIHIAAHGSSDNGEIALAPNVSPERQGIPEEDDYLLTMKEVQETGVKAQLVVLSCCYSGLGKIRAEGMVGLSRAFLAAGARAVVASLWAIDDMVTFSFMVSFYNYLTRGESASVSLHKAMHEIRKEGHRDPIYRAPFFLIGDDVTLKLR